MTIISAAGNNSALIFHVKYTDVTYLKYDIPLKCIYIRIIIITLYIITIIYSNWFDTKTLYRNTRVSSF